MEHIHQIPSDRTRMPYNGRSGILSRDVICVYADLSLKDAARMMRENHIGDLVVVKNLSGKTIPVGMVTDRDLAIETYGQGVSGEDLTVGDIMSRSTATGLATHDVFKLIAIMKESGVGRLPLLDNEGNVTGIITAKRLTKILLEGLNDLFEMSQQRVANEADLRN